MYKLLEFFLRYSSFFYFIFLQAVSAWLIVNNNAYQGSLYFNTANHYAAKVLTIQGEIRDYFALTQTNEQLAAENAKLLRLLEQLKANRPPAGVSPADTFMTPCYDFVPARVVNNSISRYNNYLTINKGKAHGIEPGMGVAGPDGIVGIVRNCSENYSTVTSILHSGLLVSARLHKSGFMGSLGWDGLSADMAVLHFVPRHITVAKGEAVYTSGFDARFPERLAIGRVASVSITPDATFYEIKLKLSSKMGALSKVYVIKNRDFEEIQALEAELTNQDQMLKK